MRLIVMRNLDPSALVARPVSDAELGRYKRIRDLAARLTLYGFPMMLVVWLWLSWPDIFRKDDFASAQEAAVILALTLLLTPLLHELVHLLALPSRIALADTLFIIRLDGRRSGFATRVGGALSRENYIWTSLLPVLTLSVIPYALVFFGYKLPIWVGFAASGNFALSSLDIIQAIEALRSVPKGTIRRQD